MFFKFTTSYKYNKYQEINRYKKNWGSFDKLTGVRLLPVNLDRRCLKHFVYS